MQANRRSFTLGLAALSLSTLSLSACAGGGGGARPAARGFVEASFPAVPNAGFDTWVAGFRGRALARGISAGTVDSALRGAGFLPGVIERDRNQTEFTRTLEDYLAIAASDERLSLGRQMVQQYGGVLAEVEGQYGVDRHIVAAVWGLESFFGTRRGSVPVISALATLAYDGRRGEFFESQLVAALKILQNGDVSPAGMTGSWAGAMGHTQFIPTSYLAYAVDFRGDGRRDIWSDDPTDALASTGAYLAKSGWVRGQRWGVEVQPDGSRDMQGRAVEGGGSLIRPMGAGGPSFVIYRNFQAILRYNNAQNYAIGVGHLADRLAGGGPIQGAFPPDANGLTKADRQDLQRRLTAAGFDTEGSDGVIGTKTRNAISAYQGRNGMAVTGEPSVDLLNRLRG